MSSIGWLTKALNEQGTELTDQRQQQFQTYYRLLVEWSEKVNLASIIDEHEVYLKHFYDSITAGFYYDFNQPLTPCDVGAGAGLPSTPLKAVFPELEVTIVGSLSKRIQFLNHPAVELGLTQIGFAHDRAETFGKGVSREAYDVVTARAVARLTVLSESCLPLVRKDSQSIVLKSAKGEEELAEAQFGVGILGGAFSDFYTFDLPGDAGKRQTIIVGKRRRTPKKYPRRPGTPNKAPSLEN